jgi:protoheme IX farnesyltransferase
VAHTGALYPIVAGVAGAGFLWQAFALHGRVRRGFEARSMKLFQWSITYLTLVFAAVAADAVLIQISGTGRL